MRLKYNRCNVDNSGSMADIAFLLLIFFLVSTTIKNDQGLTIKLPPKPEDQIELASNSRNIFKILVNSNNEVMAQGERKPDLIDLKNDIKKFILNYGSDPLQSDHPHKAIISLKTNRGSNYGKYIEVLDEMKAAYHEIYADKLGISVALFLKSPKQLNNGSQIKSIRAEIPMNISIAEPSN